MSTLIVLALTTTQVLNLVTYVTFAIAIVGLLVTIYALRQGFDQAMKFETVSETASDTLDRLELVMEALPTRVLGEWPEALLRQAEFITRTERYLKIVVDVPSYGIFTDFEGHQAYQRALEDCLLQGHELSMIFMTKESRRHLNEEFATQKERSWAQPYAAEVLDWYARAKAYNPTLPKPTDFEGYLDVLEHTNQHAVTRLENAARTGSDRVGRKLFTRRETETMFPLYIWVRDGEEAIFAVAMISLGVTREIAFITRDLGLVNALEAAYDRYTNQPSACSGDLAQAWPRMAGEAPAAVTA
jgi:hypothetical protein